MGFPRHTYNTTLVRLTCLIVVCQDYQFVLSNMTWITLKYWTFLSNCQWPLILKTLLVINCYIFHAAYEMLWCASQCGSLNGTSSPSSSPTSSSGGSSSGSSPDVIGQPYLNFGDYSVFASDMKRAYAPEKGSRTPPDSKIPHKNIIDTSLPSADEFISKCKGKFQNI